jgi:hypothetical protein
MSSENIREDVKTVRLVSGLAAAGYLGVGVINLATVEIKSGTFEAFAVGLILVALTMLLSFYLYRP